MTPHLPDQPGGPAMTLAAWADMDEGEPGELVDGHHWIVDPALRSLEIFELGADGRYVKAIGAASGIIDTVPGCKGLTVDLDALWDEASQLEADGNE